MIVIVGITVLLVTKASDVGVPKHISNGSCSSRIFEESGKEVHYIPNLISLAYEDGLIKTVESRKRN